MKRSNSKELSSQPLIDNLQKNDIITTPQQRRRRVAKGESDFDTLRYFYYIICGKIKISQINFENGKEQILHLLGADDMFDVTTLLDGKPHDLLIVTLEDSEVLEVPLRSAKQLLDNEPAFQKFFFPYVAKQLRSMEDLTVDLSLYTLYERLLHLLVRNIDPNSLKPKLTKIDNLSHEELASMVGSVRKVVNRTLQQLKKEGIINLSRKKIELNNIQKLLKKLEQ